MTPFSTQTLKLPATGDSVKSSITESEMQAIAEEIGAAVHRLRVAKRHKEKGWHTPEECPSKQEPDRCQDCWRQDCDESERLKDSNGKCEKFGCTLCHTCMRPYKDLSDREKELDREYPRAFMAILERHGFSLISTAALNAMMAFVPKD